MKRAFITGITGQDGSYLAELLVQKGYEVHGLVRRSSSFNTQRIDHLYLDSHVMGVRMFLHYGDLSDAVRLTKLLYELRPDEVYHLGAQSHVRVSFDMPEYTSDITGLGTIRILDAIRESGISHGVRFYQASSSELFGNAPAPQNEAAPFAPRSPYACAKLYAYWITRNYRDAYAYDHGWVQFIENMGWAVQEMEKRELPEEKIVDFICQVIGRIYWQTMDAHEALPKAEKKNWSALQGLYDTAIAKYANTGAITIEKLREGYFKVAGETPLASVPYMTFDKFLKKLGFNTGVN